SSTRDKERFRVSPYTARSSSRIRLSITLASCTLPVVTPTVCTSPLLASTPMCAFMPKYRWLPFFDERISGSRFCASFFVDGDAAISRRVDDGAATQQRTAGLQKLRNSGEYRLRQLVALQEMPEVQDGRLVGNCVASELQTCERAHRADVVKHFFRAGIGEVVPLLQAINPQHHGQRKRPPPAIRTSLGIMRLDHSLERDPRHHGCHLSQEHITLGALLLGRIVERRKTQLVHPST